MDPLTEAREKLQRDIDTLKPITVDTGDGYRKMQLVDLEALAALLASPVPPPSADWQHEREELRTQIRELTARLEVARSTYPSVSHVSGNLSTMGLLTPSADARAKLEQVRAALDRLTDRALQTARGTTGHDWLRRGDILKDFDAVLAVVLDAALPPHEGETPPPAAESGWLDIASAPKDKTDVLLWWPYWSRVPVVGYWKHGRWNGEVACSDETDGHQPTHWMPLPLPPRRPDEAGAY